MNFIFFALTAFAATKTYSLGSRTLTLDVTPLKPAVVVDASSSRSTNQTVQTYLVYQRLLAQGRIEAASKYTADPAATVKTQKAYMARIGGADAYRRQFAQLMKEHLTITHVISDGKLQMLIGSHPSAGTFANFFDCTSGKCLLTEDLDHGTLKDLADLFGQIREGKAKL